MARKILLALAVLLGLLAATAIVLRFYDEKTSRPAARASSSEILMALSTPLPEFRLTDQSGRPFGSPDLKGKVWVSDFIFTRCQGPCPLQTARMAGLQKDFTDAPDLRFVSFSVDPGYDTPPVLADYAARYGADPARWHFLTGPTEALYKLIREDFHLALLQRKEPGWERKDVTHSLSFVLVGRDGRIRGYFEGNDPEEMTALRKKIREIL